MTELQMVAEIDRTAKLVKEREEAAENELLSLMGQIARRLKEDLPPQVEAFVTKQFDVTTALADRVPELKGELSEFYGSLGSKVREWLDHDRFWQHRPGFAKAAGEQYTGSYKSMHGASWSGIIADAVQGPIDRFLYVLLKKYAYNTAYSDSDFKINWGNLGNALNDYARSLDVVKAAKTSHKTAAQTKGEHDAKALWLKA